MTDALHSDWAPSAMSRILSCPASVELVKLYPNEDSEASSLGTVAHSVLEDCLTFGLPPSHSDFEINEGIELALKFVEERLEEYGPKCELHVERRVRLEGTPIWGTADLIFVTPSVIHIADYKHGYLPVKAELNAQLMTYLEGAIQEFGERRRYKVTVIQPRYDHADGPIRSYEPSTDDLDWFRGELEYALSNREVIKAGKHCKYCPAMGECAAFIEWSQSIYGKALYYEMTNKHTVTDETIAELLDLADMLPGWIKSLRGAAYRRQMQDRSIPGWKVVPGASRREFRKDAGNGLAALYSELGLPEDALYESSPISPATAEKHIKSVFKGKKNNEEPLKKLNKLITAKSGAPSLVRTIDGRPELKRGAEFDELPDSDGNIIV